MTLDPEGHTLLLCEHHRPARQLRFAQIESTTIKWRMVCVQLETPLARNINRDKVQATRNLLVHGTNPLQELTTADSHLTVVRLLRILQRLNSAGARFFRYKLGKRARYKKLQFGSHNECTDGAD